MERFDVTTDTGLRAGLTAAVSALRQRRLVAIPTETVYGLAADATDGRAVAAIYEAKGRPSFNPLIAHVPDLAAAEAEARFDDVARRLAERFWPGPLTLVLPRRAGGTVCDLATAGLDTVGLRIPANRTTRELIRRFGRPLAAPSANRSGHVSPTAAADVIADLGESVAVVLDDGAAPVGVESTIVSVCDGSAHILRPGGVTRDAIEAALGTKVAVAEPLKDPEKPLAPGMLASHYAPRVPVRLNVAEPARGEAVLDFAGQLRAIRPSRAQYRDLSPTGDLTEAAANLFRALRDLDRVGASGIAVAPIPDLGLGEAINDRLARAAAPRLAG